MVSTHKLKKCGFVFGGRETMFYLSGGDSSDSNNNVERVHPEGGYLYQFLQEQEGVQRTAQTKATFPGC